MAVEINDEGKRVFPWIKASREEWRGILEDDEEVPSGDGLYWRVICGCLQRMAASLERIESLYEKSCRSPRSRRRSGCGFHREGNGR